MLNEIFKWCLIDSLNSDRVDKWTEENKKTIKNVEDRKREKIDNWQKKNYLCSKNVNKNVRKHEETQFTYELKFEVNVMKKMNFNWKSSRSSNNLSINYSKQLNEMIDVRKMMINWLFQIKSSWWMSRKKQRSDWTCWM